MIVVDRFDPQLGIRTRVHDVDGKVTFQKTYDAEPMLKRAAEARAANAGKRWGEGQRVGEVPMSVIGEFMRQDGCLRHERLEGWLKANPAFVHFESFLK